MPELGVNLESKWISDVIMRAIDEAIAREIRQRMPSIVSAACADVTGRIDQLINYTRMGTDLRITVLNAYKPEEK